MAGCVAMKNEYIDFILKPLSVLKIFKFLPGLFSHVEKNGLIGKFMTSQTG